MSYSLALAAALAAIPAFLPPASSPRHGDAARFSSSRPAERESIEWFRRYSRARAEARRTGKPIFLEFRCQP